MKAWLKLSRLEIAFASVGVLVLLAGIAEAWEWFGLFSAKIWQHGASGWDGEATRSIFLTIGALAALYGIILAARRNDISQKQAETAEKNLFNDRLGRGVELLTHKDMTFRTAGVRILENLGEASKEYKIVAEILLDWVRNEISLPFESEEDESPPPEDYASMRLDIGRAIHALGNIIPESSNRNIKLNLRGLDLRSLDLSGANLRGAELSSADLEGANLVNAKLEGATLISSNLQGVDLMGAKLAGANLSKANLRSASLYEANLQGANLFKSGCQFTTHMNTNLQSADLRYADFSNAFLTRTNLLGADLTKTILKGVQNLGQEILDKSIYEDGKRPLHLPRGLKLPTHRAYKLSMANWNKVFVESGKNVDECVAKQIKKVKKKT